MIVFNFDVLARPHPEFGSRVPDPEGLYMWRALYEASVGRMAVVVSGEANNDTLETWLKLNQVKASTYDIFGTSEPGLCAEKVARLLAAAGGRSMYFDVNPATVAHTMKLGVFSSLVCPPYVVRPEWSTEKVMRDWESLTQEIDRQALMRSEKQWGDIE